MTIRVIMVIKDIRDIVVISIQLRLSASLLATDQQKLNLDWQRPEHLVWHRPMREQITKNWD